MAFGRCAYPVMHTDAQMPREAMNGRSGRSRAISTVTAPPADKSQVAAIGQKGTLGLWPPSLLFLKIFCFTTS
jgi:hypothetical protein